MYRPRAASAKVAKKDRGRDETAEVDSGCESPALRGDLADGAQSNTRMLKGLNKRALTCGQTLSACGWPACVLSSAKLTRADRQSGHPVVG